jgi:hypothetical protein
MTVFCIRPWTTDGYARSANRVPHHNGAVILEVEISYHPFFAVIVITSADLPVGTLSISDQLSWSWWGGAAVVWLALEFGEGER